MPSYRTTKYGVVEASLLDPSLKMVCDGMKVYISSAGNDFNYQCAPRVVAELLKQFRLVTGDDFRSWLAANYNQGVGVRASLVRSILSFLNGEISGMMVSDAIMRDVRKLILYIEAGQDPTTGIRHVPDTQHLTKWVKLLENTTNSDMYRLVEGIGFVALARLVVSLSGDPADV